MSGHFNFEKVQVSFLDGDITYSTSYSIDILQRFSLARVCSKVIDCKNRKKL